MAIFRGHNIPHVLIFVIITVRLPVTSLPLNFEKEKNLESELLCGEETSKTMQWTS